MRTLKGVLVAVFLTSILPGCGSKQVSYKSDIQPILDTNCVDCHGGKKTKGKINLTSYDSCMGARSITDKGPIVQPGNLAGSRLYILCATEQIKYRMPPDTFHLKAIPPEQLATLGKWIMQGARNN